MNILFIGDIVGAIGQNFLKKNVKFLKKKWNINLIIANAENSAEGSGITCKIANNLYEYGINILTLGDHVWDKKGFEEDINNIPYICRPANLPYNNPGKKYIIFPVFDKNNKDKVYKIGIFTLLGTQLIKLKVDCPFKVADLILKENINKVDFWIVEIHAETTSEKIALGWYLDGKVNAIIGTHTHVITDDLRILPKGTAYISDIGMCGSFHAILGRSIPNILYKSLYGFPTRMPIAQRNIKMSGCLLNINNELKVNKAFSIVYPPFIF